MTIELYEIRSPTPRARATAKLPGVAVTVRAHRLTIASSLAGEGELVELHRTAEFNFHTLGIAK